MSTKMLLIFVILITAVTFLMNPIFGFKILNKKWNQTKSWDICLKTFTNEARSKHCKEMFNISKFASQRCTVLTEYNNNYNIKTI